MAKPVLYIIHGWTYTTEHWKKTLVTLEKLGIEPKMLNVPGLTAPSKAVWTIADYMKWADGQIPDGAVALGHSNGGRILLNLCSQNPAKLKHLILLDAAGVYEPSTKRDVARTLSKGMGFLKKVPGATKVWHKLTGSSDYARAPENMKKTLSNMLDSDRDLAIKKVTTPTSIIWGKADTTTPSRQAEKMRQELPNSTLEMHEGWTHAPYISHPEELARVIFRILKNPPRNPQVVDDTLSVSAAHALKRASGPVLSSDQDVNGVVPGAPTKLELKNGKISPAEKIVISEEDAAAIKYDTKPPKEEPKPTDVAEKSASANFKKAQTKASPQLDSTAVSASASLPKVDKKGLLFQKTHKRSASLSLKAKENDRKKKSLDHEKGAATVEKEENIPIVSGEVMTSERMPEDLKEQNKLEIARNAVSGLGLRKRMLGRKNSREKVDPKSKKVREAEIAPKMEASEMVDSTVTSEGAK